jgi:GAF domain-containing protein
VLRRLGLRSMMVVPLLVRGHLAGVWLFGADRRGRYTDADLAVAQEVGGRVALAAENARLSHAREEFVSTAVHEIISFRGLPRVLVRETLMKESRVLVAPEFQGRFHNAAWR